MTSTFSQPDYATQTGTEYPLSIDAAIDVLKRSGAAFAPHEQSPANMTVRVDAGALFNNNAVQEVAGQTTLPIAAPVGNPRIDRVTINSLTGAVQVVTGAEASVPVAPAVPPGDLPIARVNLTVGITEITNNEIVDERVGAGGGSSSGGRLTGIVVYDTPGAHTYVPSPGTRFVLARPFGACGGGGNSSAGASIGGGGGGGGGMAEDIVDVTAVASVPVTVGAGGNKGSGFNDNGANGGTSSFGTFVSATGGTGGNSNSTGGSGGTGQNGLYNGQGSSGHNGVADGRRNGGLAPYGAGEGGKGNSPGIDNSTVGDDGKVIIWEFSG